VCELICDAAEYCIRCAAVQEVNTSLSDDLRHRTKYASKSCVLFIWFAYPLLECSNWFIFYVFFIFRRLCSCNSLVQVHKNQTVHSSLWFVFQLVPSDQNVCLFFIMFAVIALRSLV
jgi:hypothetical protein